MARKFLAIFISATLLPIPNYAQVPSKNGPLTKENIIYDTQTGSLETSPLSPEEQVKTRAFIEALESDPCKAGEADCQSKQKVKLDPNTYALMLLARDIGEAKAANFFQVLEVSENPSDKELLDIYRHYRPKFLKLKETQKLPNNTLTKADITALEGGILKTGKINDPGVREHLERLFFKVAYTREKNKFSKNVPEYLKPLAKSMLERLRKAYSILSDKKLRDSYRKQIEAVKLAEAREAQARKYIAEERLIGLEGIAHAVKPEDPGRLRRFYERQKLAMPAHIQGNVGFMVGAAMHTLLKAYMTGDPALVWSAWDGLKSIEGMVGLMGFAATASTSGALISKIGGRLGPLNRVFKIGPRLPGLLGMALGSGADHYIQKFLGSFHSMPYPFYESSDWWRVYKNKWAAVNEIVRLRREIYFTKDPQKKQEMKRLVNTRTAQANRWDKELKVHQKLFFGTYVQAAKDMIKSEPGEWHQLAIHGTQLLLSAVLVNSIEGLIGRKLFPAEAAKVADAQAAALLKLPKGQRPVQILLKNPEKPAFQVQNWRVFNALGEQFSSSRLSNFLAGIFKSSIHAIGFLTAIEVVTETTRDPFNVISLKKQLNYQEKQILDVVDRFVRSEKDIPQDHETLNKLLEDVNMSWEMFRQNTIKARMFEHMSGWDGQMTEADQRFNRTREYLLWLARGGLMTDDAFIQNGGVGDWGMLRPDFAFKNPDIPEDEFIRLRSIQDLNNYRAREQGKPEHKSDLRNNNSWHVDSVHAQALSDEVQEMRSLYKDLVAPYDQCRQQGRSDCPDPQLLVLPFLESEQKNYLMELHSITEERRTTMRGIVYDTYFKTSKPLSAGEFVPALKNPLAPLFSFFEAARRGFLGLVTNEQFKPRFTVAESLFDEMSFLKRVFLKVMEKVGLSKFDRSKYFVGGLLNFNGQSNEDLTNLAGSIELLTSPPLNTTFATEENGLAPYTQPQKAEIVAYAFAKAIWRVIGAYHFLGAEAHLMVAPDEKPSVSTLSNPFETNGAAGILGFDLRRGRAAGYTEAEIENQIEDFIDF